MSRKIAEHMTWHLKCCGDTDEVIHPAQSEAWRHFDQIHPSFKREPRNVRLEMCMRPEFTFLTLVIAGPKSPGYGMVAGWSTHGQLSCLYCMEMTQSFYLQNGRKPFFFDCHHQFLPESHSFRFDQSNFLKGRVELGSPLPRLDGVSMRHLLDVLFGKPFENQTIEGFGNIHNWVKRLFGMKSHDCHVFMQRLIPVAFRGLLPSAIWGSLTDISNFVRSLCSLVIKVTEMHKWEAKIVEIICKLEIIFPPAFFDSMEHLAIHLPYEARVGGPVQFRWMYPFERRMRKRKSTIGNKNHVEASIVEAFILYEISHFCSRYFGDDVETSWNQPLRNYGGIGTNVPGTTINSPNETDYYGVLKEVIELLYYGHSCHQETIILFNCDWYDTNRGIRVNVEHGIVDVNTRFKLSTGEPFCLVSQAQQVYYTPYLAAMDRTTRGWLAACKIKSRHLIETSSTSSSGEVNDIFQDDDPSIMQGSSFAIDLTAYQSLQLCAKGVTEGEVDANTSEEEEDYGEEKDSESSGNSDNVEDECLEILQSDNLRDKKLKWDKKSAYVPCWIPTHIWPQLLTYWDSDEYKRLSARGAKNRSSGERTKSRGGVQPPHQEKFKETHTFRKKAGKDQEPAWINEKAKYRYDTYVVECTDSHGSDASSWPCMDNEAWVKAVGGCSSNFMPGSGSQVNLEMVGFTYKKRQPRENLIAALMASDYEELERQCQQIALMQQQLANMTEAQNNMSQTIAQSVAAALAVHSISPQAGHHPIAPPQPSHGPSSSLRMNSAFTYSTDSTQTSPMVLECQQQR
ncbi:hypothetical protein SLEP1_g9679 [Rubroshorea leprosula]|uniref:DUF4218 domain-containing protein n=1 Tax=Rubroshorea leprosula TaxID=152421 RepID=A0AAV5IA68_9ROSI|nr:hypothetical protein SLEP1_g9679 [Rubroshorea leprosula]